ncbi:C-type natriuretic peptide [Macrotis lagotis]|uniref:C-type natriuretic peptide n=1 Tax=Macrotis lagotis TaxID=92651 RepID=UPI003D693EC8
MRVSRLLAWTFLLALLSLGPEAKPAAPQKPPRTPPGAEPAAAGADKKAERAAGGGGAPAGVPAAAGARLLRDLRADTRSRAAWARLLHDHPSARKLRGVNKKGLSKGCFGLKLDRIGSLSGLGC